MSHSRRPLIILPHYKPPFCRYLAEKGLDITYTTIKSLVDTEIQKETHLNICFDGASNISHQRLLNVSVVTARAAFYYHNTVIGSGINTAKYQVNHIISIISHITDGHKKPVNLICGDTYP
jgi:hypothetical protein